MEKEERKKIFPSLTTKYFLVISMERKKKKRWREEREKPMERGKKERKGWRKRKWKGHVDRRPFSFFFFRPFLSLPFPHERSHFSLFCPPWKEWKKLKLFFSLILPLLILEKEFQEKWKEILRKSWIGWMYQVIESVSSLSDFLSLEEKRKKKERKMESAPIRNPFNGWVNKYQNNGDLREERWPGKKKIVTSVPIPSVWKYQLWGHLLIHSKFDTWGCVIDTLRTIFWRE